MVPNPEVDQYLRSQPPHMQEILHACRQVLFSLEAKGMQESIKWKIPFYTYHGIYCFLNPKKDKYVLWGFCEGAFLSDDHQLFIKGKQKRIRHLSISEPEQAYREEVFLLLQEAMEWNINRQK